MAMRVAMIGYGAVGSIHAANLVKEPDVELSSVYGPKEEKASAFAVGHGVRNVSPTLADACSRADLAIVCSPSTVHFQQARACLQAGLHTLVELPPCEKSSEAEELGALARRQGVLLGCAHTSRYLTPYARIGECIRKGVLGDILEMNYIRYHKLRERSWTDNALLHHAAHPLDLLLAWCGGIEPRGCVALPTVTTAQTVSVLGKLPRGGAATVTVTFASRLPQIRMLVVGKNHTFETDGFSYLQSDLPELRFTGDGQRIYEDAIRDQDIQFLNACQGKGSFVSWDETVRLLQIVEQFQALS
jgi:2-hydroxy-4-carboxymuconate semialdehyde hemiacetal dehydrogenase